jgi:biopolymer transport protein ExbB/TolQ
MASALLGEIPCPHCGRETPRPDPGEGRVADCAHCERSFVAAPGDLEPALAAAPARRRPETTTSAPTEIDLTLSGLAAAAISLVFYLGVVSPLRDSYFGQLFAARGWVPYAITWLSAWAFVALAQKLVRLSRERRALALDLLPQAIAERITPRNAHLFAAYLRHLGDVRPERFVFDRLERAVEHFRVRPHVPEVIEQAAGQAQSDAAAVEASYTMLRVVVWAVPILGFIGTVLGIGSAVAAFSDSVGAAVDIEVMKQSIGTVTTGLAVAFDTTLLALVMSLVIMFPASSLQKAEEAFLARVQELIERQLVRRLDDGGAALPSRLDSELGRLAGAIADLERRLAPGA